LPCTGGTIKGEKKAENEEEDKNYRKIERSYSSFYRSIELPAGTDIDKIQATLSKGVPKVVIPKAAPRPDKESRGQGCELHHQMVLHADAADIEQRLYRPAARLQGVCLLAVLAEKRPRRLGSHRLHEIA
jgi:hypothetical protein